MASLHRLDKQILNKACVTGWGGKGLGAKEQGIVNPIDAGEVRDKTDMYKGVGVSNNDPFEQFRKNKSQGFITRMQARETGTAECTVPQNFKLHPMR